MKQNKGKKLRLYSDIHSISRIVRVTTFFWRGKPGRSLTEKDSSLKTN